MFLYTFDKLSLFILSTPCRSRRTKEDEERRQQEQAKMKAQIEAERSKLQESIDSQFEREREGA